MVSLLTIANQKVGIRTTKTVIALVHIRQPKMVSKTPLIRHWACFLVLRHSCLVSEVKSVNLLLPQGQTHPVTGRYGLTSGLLRRVLVAAIAEKFYGTRQDAWCIWKYEKQPQRSAYASQESSFALPADSDDRKKSIACPAGDLLQNHGCNIA